MSRNSGSWLLVLLAVSSAGAAVIFVEGVPLYRRLLAGDVARYGSPELSLFLRALAAVSVMQTAHWIRVAKFPAARIGSSLAVAYFFSFASRLSFIFAGGLFSATLIVRPGDIHPTFTRMALLMAVLFAMYCYTLDLEACARAFAPPVPAGGPAPSRDAKSS